jgi:hypothetical protein
MNRTLRRPMFRIGGTAEGITSGLQPRQGYEGTGQAWDQFVKKIPDIKEQAKAMSYKPRGTNIYDFMTEMGLDLVSRPKSGNIFQQVATSAKEPYSRFMERKQSAAEQEYASESDMFKTMLSSYGDILASEAESGTSAKQFDKENTARMISEWITAIDSNEKLLDNPDLSEDKRAEIKLQIQIDKTNLRNLKKKNVYAESILKSDKYVKGFVSTIMERLKKKKKEDGSPMYPDPDNNPDLYRDAYTEFVRYFEEEYATGGRVGYQIGGDVMPGAMPTDQAAGPTDQGPEVPAELQNIDYETLRARLPSSVTDDIVRLIATSAEAMEDFATIQTQQDINNFNEKYGVELVLPAEA